VRIEDLPLAFSPTEMLDRGVLPLSRSGLYRAIKSGQLRSVRVGRRIVVPRGAILDFLGESDSAGRGN
jgi:excisionase family DNA binding protein